FEYDDFFAYFFNMLKSYACQKLDADVNIFFSFFSSGNIEIAPFWRSRSDKYSIVIFLQHLLHAFHKSVEMRVNTHIEDIIHFLIQNRFGKAEGRYLCAHHTTAFVPLIIQVDFITQRSEVSGNSQRSRSSAD